MSIPPSARSSSWPGPPNGGRKLRRYSPHPPPIRDPSMATYLALTRVCRQLYHDLIQSSFLYRHKPLHFSSQTILANYLKAIDPTRRDAITAIHLRIPLYSQPRPPNCIPMMRARPLSRAALLSLAALPSLRFLKLEIAADSCLQVFYPSRPSPPPPTAIRHDALEIVTKSKHIRDIKGLRGFEVVFRIDYRSGLWSSYPGRMLPNRRGADEELTPEGRVGEELRAVLLQGGGFSKDMEWMFRVDDA